ncbi:MAG: hypothetical protein F9K31_02530 [Dokdonella sp.]|nr:MAG: hypothetical protein F9K31_02530 [Dokdonella sp.]
MRMRKIALFAKKETVYGTAVALTGAEAIRTHELKVTPFAANTIERNLDGAAFGNGGVIHAGAHLEIEFDVEMSGSGTAGTAPAYGPLLKACQMSETINAGTDVTYAPASNGTDSLTMYVQLDGQRHATRGARGTWSIKFDSQGIPYIHFKFVGLWVDPTTTADLVPDFTGFKTPRPVTVAYTPMISLHGVSSVYRSFSYDHANDVQYFDNPGEEFVDIMDRKPAGSISLLAPALSTKNYFTTAKADTQGALTLVHGMTAGNIVTFSAPNTQLLEPKYGDDKGRAMLDANLAFIYDTGDDEMSLTFT